MERVDVAIVGGGLVGASLAAALGRSGRSVALIESAPPPRTAPSWDERCIALNHASRLILEDLGVWPAVSAEAEPILSTHISERGRFGVARFDSSEAGLPALGYNVPLRALGQRLWEAAQATTAQLRCPARLSNLTVTGDAARLELDHPDGKQALEARLVVAADGAASPLRELMGVEARHDDYGQSAIVTAVRARRPHRGCAYERFTPDGPIAILPKPGNDCSLVWTLPTARAAELVAIDGDAFLRQAQETFGERLGTFTGLGRRAAWPLSRVLSDRLHAPRVLFAGNAAQALHPVAAQGFNLGLRDVAAIAALLRAHAGDPGEPALLAKYAAGRERDRRTVARFTDGLVRLFSNRVPGLSSLRHLGLLALDLAPPLKDAVLWQNLGFVAPGGAR